MATAAERAAEQAAIAQAVQAMTAADAPPQKSTNDITEEDLELVDDALSTVEPDVDDDDEGAGGGGDVEGTALGALLDEDDDPIEKLIAGAKEKRGGVHEASSKAERLVRDAEEKAAKILKDAEAQVQERVRGIIARMGSDPLAVATDLNVDVNDVLRSTAEANDPVNQIKRLFLQELKKRDAEIGELRTVVSRTVQDKEEEKRTAQQERYNRMQQKFLDDADEENFPAINLYWGKKRLLGEAFEESRAIHEAAELLGGKPEFTDRQIIARLEKKARAELIAVSEKLQKLIATMKTAPAPAAPEKGKAAAKAKPAPKTVAPAASGASTKTSTGSPSAKRRFRNDKEEHAYLVKLATEISNKKKAKVA